MKKGSAIMRLDEILRMYEKRQEKASLKKAFKEGKVKKFDDDFLEELAFYDYGRFPLLTYILCHKLLGRYHNEITLVLANFLLAKGQVNLLKEKNSGYSILELITDDKKYIYDIGKKLVFDEDYYFTINSGVEFKKTIFTNEIFSTFPYSTFLVQVIDSNNTRDELLESMLADYKNNVDISPKTNASYEKMASETKEARKFKREKIIYFD